MGSQIDNYKVELFAIFQTLKWALELNLIKEELQKFENSSPNSILIHKNSRSNNINLIHQNSNNANLYDLNLIDNNSNLSKMDLI